IWRSRLPFDMIWTAFLLGFLGSFHCLGMCGPIALVISARDNNRFLTKKIVYNMGRSAAYSPSGIGVGTIGVSLQLAGVQQWLSLLTGAAVVIMALFYKRRERWISGLGFAGMAGAVKRRRGKFLRMGGGTAFFAGGLINGLLPC